MIVLENVSVTFKNKASELHAVKDVSLTIEEGEIFGIVGGSGAGKSTLVRTLNALQKPTSGKIIIEGQDITKLGPSGVRNLRKKIGMIFQHFNLISRKTVGKNIEFALKIQRYPKDKRDKRVDELLGLVGLQDKKDVYPASLSGGQKQRVGIARALAANPKILLCDEATSALDVHTTEEIVDILRDINKQLGITIVFITHQLEVAKHLFNKVAVMSEGKIVEINKAYEIFANPKEAITKKLVKSNITIPDKIAKQAKGSILTLTYKGEKSVEPIIAYTNKKYDVVLNILHGKIEYIQNKPIGILVVSIEGEEQALQEALSYIRANVEEIEILEEKERDKR
ncbi:MAG: Phosphonate-transporting ATPase [Clostridia bacterium]|jgi:D-methionine transport system ATP-binding protein|nr:Phosphonate-transporting ATPase [Clostridia bacterium]